MSPKQLLDQDEVSLTGRLAEFRFALREEIDAARRNESSLAIPLINGRLIAQVSGSYQYSFDIENPLNLPGDSPGDLYVQDHRPLEVTIIAVEGMRIILGVPEDLGQVVANARLQSNLAQLMRKLIDRIEALACRNNPVGDRILGDLPISGEPLKVDTNDTNLNANQLSAIASSLGRNATFIWGPPGTGKTRTIGAIGKHLYMDQRSVLLVSHTNAAVDEAIIRIADSMHECDLAEGKILRVGDCRDNRLKDEKYKEVLLKTHTDRRAQELAAQRDMRKEQRSAAFEEEVHISRLIDVMEWITEAERDISNMSQELQEIDALRDLIEEKKEDRKTLMAQESTWSSATEEAKYAKTCISQLNELERNISDQTQILYSLKKDLDTAQSELFSAEKVLEQSISVAWLTRRWRGLPSPEKQRDEVKKLSDVRDDKKSKYDAVSETIFSMKKKQVKFQFEIDDFTRRYSAFPDYVLSKATEFFTQLKTTQSDINRLHQESVRRGNSLEIVLTRRLQVLREWGFTSIKSSDPTVMLSAIDQAHQIAKSQTKNQTLPALRTRREDLNNSIRTFDTEIEKIEESLKRVEELVIANATVVATTLTRAYLRDSIQSRQFDTLIVDEASMAPIPAIWVAASTATNNAIMVGDFKQLPPIVISENELSKKWLGRDVFDVAGLLGLHDKTGCRVDLLEQHRMHPQISMIPNKLMYGGRLRDAEGMEKRDEEGLGEWYNKDWGYDCPVLLVDTSSCGAWVTSVARGVRASRLNFLSATICVDLAVNLLKQDRKPACGTERSRILIISPYTPHGKLLHLLIKEEGIEDDVQAGTVHSFQGKEADVVLFDLVNDEPHWRVALFMPSYNEEAQRLLNVAITRARHRLIVVGDFEYIQKLAKKAFIGRDLIPFLLSNYRCVDARIVVPSGFIARATKVQTEFTGGMVEANKDRLVVTQERFYPILQDDFAKAVQRIVIFSAFITWDRLSQLVGSLRSARERGVPVYVVTKSRDDRSRKELSNYSKIEKSLSGWGITVIHKRRMHEKLVFIDDHITWVGSLNPLSFSNTQEIMERRYSKEVASDYARTLMLNELLEAYEDGQPMCPICGNEVVASEGADDPFYWTCVEEDCYSRSVDQPPLTGGVIVCSNCGGSVELGEWGGRPVWRCKNNSRHHQRISRTHLRLPKMRELIPKKQLKKLEKLFLVSNTKNKEEGENTKQSQLFDLSE